MSKKSWRLVGWCFLVLSLVAVLSLAGADFSAINQADLKSTVVAGKNPLSSVALEEGHVSRVPILVRIRQHPTPKTASIPDCLQST
jgi:hypothetical protein